MPETELTEEQVMGQRQLVQKTLNTLAETMMKYLGPFAKDMPMVSTNLYEANRALEIVGFRFDSCFQQLMMRTEAGMAHAAQEAMSAGRVVTGAGDGEDK